MQIRNIVGLLTLIVVTQVADAQVSWTSPSPIDTTVYGPQNEGIMAVDSSGAIYVSWSEHPTIVVEFSTDRGLNWERIEYFGSDGSRIPRDLQVDRMGNLWLLWLSRQDPYSAGYVNLSKSEDGGHTFTTMFKSLAFGDGLLHERLAIDLQNSVYMLWDDAEFKLTRFRFGDVAQRLDTPLPRDTLLIGLHPRLVVSRTFNVYCVWEGSFYDTLTGYHDLVFLSPSSDTGRSFRGRIRIDPTDKVDSAYSHSLPAIAIDTAERLYVSYRRSLEVGKRDVRLVISTDNGDSFSPPLVLSDSSSEESSLCIDIQNGVNAIWSSNVDGTHHRRSVDGGGTFGPNTQVGYMGIHESKSSADGYLYLTGEYLSRTYFSRANVILSVPNNLHPKTQFSLAQNYPNPFNGSTSITFSIGASHTVDLKIFDLLGREVAPIVSQRLPAGTYTIVWNATGHSSGVYLARLVVEGDLTDVKKLTLIR